MNTGFSFLLSMFQRRQRLRIAPPPPRVSLMLGQFRQRPDLVKEAQRIQSDPHFRLMLEVLANESPANYLSPNGNADRMLGQIEGYGMALNNLAAMATLPGEQVTLESTFDDNNNINERNR